MSRCFLFIFLLLSLSAESWDPQRFVKPSKEELKKKLAPLEYEITQEEETERPFDNAYWDQKEPGIYVDVVSGEPLFSSEDKYDSKTGWPSFTKPLDAKFIVYKEDKRLLTTRTEVRSKYGDSHLGHVFDDGPLPTGKRYCMNSAALKFIPVDKLKESGYGEYADRFLTPKKEMAVFAGGCFWCMQPPFDVLEGVISTEVGYTGGTKVNPTYKEVSSGSTGHYEAIRVHFDSNKIKYDELLDVYWKNVDVFDDQGQFCDKGEQYLSAIFYQDDQQKAQAEASKKKVSQKLKKQVVTRLLPGKTFYPAEEYHQDYYRKNPIRYKFYRTRCGRDARLKEINL